MNSWSKEVSEKSKFRVLCDFDREPGCKANEGRQIGCRVTFPDGDVRSEVIPRI